MWYKWYVGVLWTPGGKEGRWDERWQAEEVESWEGGGLGEGMREGTLRIYSIQIAKD